MHLRVFKNSPARLYALTARLHPTLGRVERLQMLELLSFKAVAESFEETKKPKRGARGIKMALGRNVRVEPLASKS